MTKKKTLPLISNVFFVFLKLPFIFLFVHCLAHIVPFLARMAAQNSLITYDIRLRDSEPSLIDAYLTNGAKSIPKLVVRDQHQTDIFTWGPRPKEAQELMHGLKTTNADAEAIKTALQHWYNEDKGVSLSNELAAFY